MCWCVSIVFCKLQPQDAKSFIRFNRAEKRFICGMSVKILILSWNQQFFHTKSLSSTYCRWSFSKYSGHLIHFFFFFVFFSRCKRFLNVGLSNIIPFEMTHHDLLPIFFSLQVFLHVKFGSWFMMLLLQKFSHPSSNISCSYLL